MESMLSLALERAALPSQVPVAEAPSPPVAETPSAEPERPEPTRDASGRFTARAHVSVRGGKVV